MGSISNPWDVVYNCKECTNPWKHPPRFALFLDVEPTNNCNYECIFCERKQAARPKGYMDLQLFKKICIQAAYYNAQGIRFLRWGEPLLHKNIIDMIQMATDYGLLTHLTTNGSLLKSETIKGIIKSGLGSIIISMQGTTPEEYKKIRGKDLNLISINILNLMELRTENPHVSISTTITDEPAESVDSFVKKWEGVVDHVGIGYTRLRRLKEKPGYLKNRTKEMPKIFKCQEVMTKLSIDWDGTVSPCCLDYDQQLSVGNIIKTNLWDIWKSEEVKAIRTLLTNKREDLFKLCSTCELNYNFRGKE